MNKDKYQKSRPFRSAEEEANYRRFKKHVAREGAPLAYFDHQFIIRQELRHVRIQLELLRPELVLDDYSIDKTIVFFGSARLPSYDKARQRLKSAEATLNNDPDNKKKQQDVYQAKRVLHNSSFLKQAERLAYLISKHKKFDFYILTGGGPSFMEAANKGAYQADKPSISLNMVLPHEEEPNPYTTPELTFDFHYFAIRKMHFLIRSKAVVIFPGGFGSMDELFEVLTLMQTQKMEPIPLLLFNKTFWDNTVNFQGFVDEGTISADDLNLFSFVETAEEAWEIIRKFYS